MRPPASEHAPVDVTRCAQCGLKGGLQKSGEHLGALQDHPLDASVPADRRRAVHAGCLGASLVSRGTTEPLGPTIYPRGGRSVVHVFESGDRNGNDPRHRIKQQHKLRARCGFETDLPGDRIEWAIYAAGHPSACPGCEKPVVPYAHPYPALFQVE